MQKSASGIKYDIVVLITNQYFILTMRFIKKEDALHKTKENIGDIFYYLFDEYEIHYNEQFPNTTQIWHHHGKVWETLFIIEGELKAKWKEKGEIKEQTVRAGDSVEVENSPHTFVNESDKKVRFLAIKQVLSRENKREIFKTDKTIGEQYG